MVHKTYCVIVCCLAVACGEESEQGTSSVPGDSPSPSSSPQTTLPPPTSRGAGDHASGGRSFLAPPAALTFELPHLDAELRRRPLPEQQAYLLWLLKAQVGLSGPQLARATEIVTQAPRLGFGNPDVSTPALSQEQCVARWKGQRPQESDPLCGHPNMVRASGPGGTVCIDQFEFPNLRCEYPIVWVRASEAAALCELQNKRLCDAHEWEGACAGEVLGFEEEYHHSKVAKGFGQEYRRNRRIRMEDWHNRPRSIIWAYGSKKDPSRCGMGSGKSAGCSEASFIHCGTNNYPAGAFPDCVSPVGVYDQHGNVAEHMSFPLFPEEAGGFGYTEMKGSWFIAAETHPDDCRWRAKNWHTTKIIDPNSHNNYHLGFRCCAAPKSAPD